MFQINARSRHLTTVSLLVATLLLAGCSATFPNRSPVGEMFPQVSARSLADQPITLPDDLNGAPALLLIGYEQDTQFDIDRWILGLLQAEIPIEILEVPTIPSLAAGLAGGWIDDGMRSGVPEEDWSIVVTLYGDAASPVAEFTGNERGRIARVLVLDQQGRVVWFDDKGYSASKILKIKELVAELSDSAG